ncbi:MAG: DNA protecting protein DprA [Deltaproteobacteria bacterium RIFCSPLOWO2_02_FULL_53_8]|nr:MAG: DNA protecting protein DprA [Deltaproteobacteria bacterium RIFCSPLOWO2_02_FULL_53_8]
MDTASLRYWLALTKVKGLQLLTLKALLDRFGSPESLFKESKASIAAFSGSLADGIKAFDEWAWVDKELAGVERLGARVLTYADTGYPTQLKEINDPPVLLYIKGALPDNSFPSIAIVGTRQPTHYGLRLAETIAAELSAMGVTIVSGMARGCDAAAHKGALDAGGRTIAVLGTGVDVPYPRENTKLYERIAEASAIVAELPLLSQPLPFNFPRRNRIISGLVCGVVVVEAPLRSGALQTARLALDYNREVMAVPGHAGSPKSMGTNKLLKDGATLVETAQDVMAALSLDFTVAKQTQNSQTPDNDESRILHAIGDDSLHIDSISAKTGIDIAKTSAILLGMELKGLIRQNQGKCFLKAW